jgi:hypothetical protein
MNVARIAYDLAMSRHFSAPPSLLDNFRLADHTVSSKYRQRKPQAKGAAHYASDQRQRRIATVSKPNPVKAKVNGSGTADQPPVNATLLPSLPLKKMLI